MIINRGFSFENYTGRYDIISTVNDNNANPTIKNFHELIASIDEDIKLKTIYDFNSSNTGSIALIFASIDIKDVKAILSFCNNYGLILSSKLLAKKSVNYYLLGIEIPEYQYASIFPYYKKDHMYLQLFKYHVIQMNKLLILKTAFDSNDYLTMFNCITYFLFNTAFQVDEDYLPVTPSTRFIYYFNKFCNNKKQKFAGSLQLQDKINAFLNELQTDVENYKNNGHNYLHYEDLAHPTWQNIYSLFYLSKQVSSIRDIDEFGEINFNLNLDLLWLKEFEKHCDFSFLASSIISDVLNEELQFIRPQMKFINKKFIGDWQINSLLSAMYMELFTLISPNILIKRCANPTCNSFFESTPENTRKIYCSERCALLMAKRKQRARKKAAEDENNL